MECDPSSKSWRGHARTLPSEPVGRQANTTRHAHFSSFASSVAVSVACWRRCGVCLSVLWVAWLVVVVRVVRWLLWWPGCVLLVCPMWSSSCGFCCRSSCCRLPVVVGLWLVLWLLVFGREHWSENLVFGCRSVVRVRLLIGVGAVAD